MCGWRDKFIIMWCEERQTWKLYDAKCLKDLSLGHVTLMPCCTFKFRSAPYANTFQGNVSLPYSTIISFLPMLCILN